MSTMGSDGYEGRHYPICKRCGEEMKAHQYAPAPGVCSDCYSIYDMARFVEWQEKRKQNTAREQGKH